MTEFQRVVLEAFEADRHALAKHGQVLHIRAHDPLANGSSSGEWGVRVFLYFVAPHPLR